MTSAAGEPTDRRARRKAATRTKLVEAAKTIFARQGIDATRINEITEAADIGFGSFYNHFEGKDAIVAAVVEDAARELGAAIDAATAGLEDPAEVVSVAHRLVLDRARADPELGWLLVRLEVTHDIVSAALGGYAVRDLRRGIASGRFVVDEPHVALAATGGALLGVVLRALQGGWDVDPGPQHAAGVLRLLGVPADDAAAVAARPLPDT